MGSLSNGNRFYAASLGRLTQPASTALSGGDWTSIDMRSNQSDGFDRSASACGPSISSGIAGLDPSLQSLAFRTAQAVSVSQPAATWAWVANILSASLSSADVVSGQGNSTRDRIGSRWPDG